MIMKGLVAGLALALIAGPAFADSVHIGGGSASSAAAASASANSTNVNVNTQSQGQQQGQHQGQSQVGVNVQGQKQEANNSGNQQNINVESSLIPGVAVAPGLAAGGSQVCLGSFSVGLSGPLAGVAFGKTVVDKGCEDRQNAILLYNMGYKAEALELLKGGNERVNALFPGGAKVSALPDTTLKLNTVLGSEAPQKGPQGEPAAAVAADRVMGPHGHTTTNFGQR